MFWLATKKGVKKSFKKLKEEIKELKQDIISKKEVDLMIREAILKVQSQAVSPSLTIREQTPRSSRTPLRKKADKLLNKVEIMREIGSLLQNGHSTTEIHNIIVNEKALIKKTCFYKYLSKVREQSARTPRIIPTN